MLARTLATALLVVAAPALAQDAPRTAKQSPPRQAEAELRAADEGDHQDGAELPAAEADATDDDDAPADDDAEDAPDGDEETEAERPDDL